MGTKIKITTSSILFICKICISIKKKALKKTNKFYNFYFIVLISEMKSIKLLCILFAEPLFFTNWNIIINFIVIISIVLMYNHLKMFFYLFDFRHNKYEKTWIIFFKIYINKHFIKSYKITTTTTRIEKKNKTNQYL